MLTDDEERLFNCKDDEFMSKFKRYSLPLFNNGKFFRNTQPQSYYGNCQNTVNWSRLVDSELFGRTDKNSRNNITHYNSKCFFQFFFF